MTLQAPPDPETEESLLQERERLQSLPSHGYTMGALSLRRRRIREINAILRGGQPQREVVAWLRKRAAESKGEFDLDTFEDALPYLRGDNGQPWKIERVTVAKPLDGDDEIAKAIGFGGRFGSRGDSDGAALWGYAGRKLPKFLGGGNDAKVTQLIRELEEISTIGRPPTDPDEGHFYLTGLDGGGAEDKPHWMTTWVRIVFPAWQGVEGVEITAPNGESTRVPLPPTPGIWTWLYARGLSGDASRALPVAEAVVPKEREIRGSATARTCGACFKAHELTRSGTMVHHGYRRPGIGYIVGDCLGVDYGPFEMTFAATQALLNGLLGDAADTEEALTTLPKRRTLGIRVVKGGKTVIEKITPGDPRFARALDDLRWSLLSKLRHIWWYIALYRGAIRTWRARPDATRALGFPRFQEAPEDSDGKPAIARLTALGTTEHPVIGTCPICSRPAQLAQVMEGPPVLLGHTNAEGDDCGGAFQPPVELSPRGMISHTEGIWGSAPVEEGARTKVAKDVGELLASIAAWAARPLPSGEQPASFPASGYLPAAPWKPGVLGVLDAALAVAGDRHPNFTSEVGDFSRWITEHPSVVPTLSGGALPPEIPVATAAPIAGDGDSTTFPPYLPWGWTQSAPFSIRRSYGSDTARGLSVVAVSTERGRSYGVKLVDPHNKHQVWFDAEGNKHRSKPGYKLNDPPTFDRFEDAVTVAEQVLGVTAPGPEDTEGGTVDMRKRDAMRWDAVVDGLVRRGWTRHQDTAELTIGGGSTGEWNPEGERILTAQVDRTFLEAVLGDGTRFAWTFFNISGDPDAMAADLNEKVREKVWGPSAPSGPEDPEPEESADPVTPPESIGVYLTAGRGGPVEDAMVAAENALRVPVTQAGFELMLGYTAEAIGALDNVNRYDRVTIDIVRGKIGRAQRRFESALPVMPGEYTYPVGFAWESTDGWKRIEKYDAINAAGDIAAFVSSERGRPAHYRDLIDPDKVAGEIEFDTRQLASAQKAAAERAEQERQEAEERQSEEERKAAKRAHLAQLPKAKGEALASFNLKYMTKRAGAMDPVDAWEDWLHTGTDLEGEPVPEVEKVKASGDSFSNQSEAAYGIRRARERGAGHFFRVSQRRGYLQVEFVPLLGAKSVPRDWWPQFQDALDEPPPEPDPVEEKAPKRKGRKLKGWVDGIPDDTSPLTSLDELVAMYNGWPNDGKKNVKQEAVIWTRTTVDSAALLLKEAEARLAAATAAVRKHANANARREQQSAVNEANNLIRVLTYRLDVNAAEPTGRQAKDVWKAEAEDRERRAYELAVQENRPRWRELWKATDVAPGIDEIPGDELPALWKRVLLHPAKGIAARVGHETWLIGAYDDGTIAIRVGPSSLLPDSAPQWVHVANIVKNGAEAFADGEPAEDVDPRDILGLVDGARGRVMGTVDGTIDEKNDAIKMVSVAMSNDPRRQGLAQVSVIAPWPSGARDFQEDTGADGVAVATDGHRLALVPVPVATFRGTVAFPFAFSGPASILAPQGLASVVQQDRFLFLGTAEPPDFFAVVPPPDEKYRVLTFDKPTLALLRKGPPSTKTNPEFYGEEGATWKVVFGIYSNGEAAWTATSAEMGRVNRNLRGDRPLPDDVDGVVSLGVRVEVPTQRRIDPFPVAFNAHYTKDAADMLWRLWEDGDDACLQVQHPLGPALILHTRNDGKTLVQMHVLMPMRTD